MTHSTSNELLRLLEEAANRLAFDDEEDASLIPSAIATIKTLTARVAELEGAIRKFPHFENDDPITAEAISKVAGEHVDMIMSWVPVQTKIAFVDDDGRQFEIVYEDGDSDAGIPSGWCVPEDADWQPARRGIESELAEARKVDDAEVVEAVDWLLDRAECSSVTLDPSPMGPIADLLTRLSAALKEAERRETEAKTLQHQLASDLTVAIVRAQAAEAKLAEAQKIEGLSLAQTKELMTDVETLRAKLETARRDALEEAAREVETSTFGWLERTKLAAAIRALQTKDTTP